MNSTLQEKIDLLPQEPGIYKMLSSSAEILYIGKAKNLRNRVRSYFNKTAERELTRLLVEKIADIEIIVTRTEKEALILENNLIKDRQPRFNINLKDNKTYPYIKITTDEPWPRIIKTRYRTRGGLYFGPYTDVQQLYDYLKIVDEFFPLKKCSRRTFPRGYKPCIYYHMGKCLGFCTGQISKDDVNPYIEEASAILSGNAPKTMDQVMERIKRASEEQRYEHAAHLKKIYDSLRRIADKQLVSYQDARDFDVLNYVLAEGALTICVMMFRGGRLMNTNTYHFENEIFSEDTVEQSSMERDELFIDTLTSFLVQYYMTNPYLVRELIVPIAFPQQAALEEIISEHLSQALSQNGSTISVPIQIIAPQRGDRLRLIELAKSNARLSFYQLKRDREKQQYGPVLRDFLKLKKVPRVVESFDIANTGDRAIVAGMVRFVDGARDTGGYRIFNMRDVKSQDDFAAMAEAVYRRYRRLLDEGEELPDLIMIDGGKGQLSAASGSLLRLGIKGQPIIALAKREEEVFVPKKPVPLRIPPESAALSFLIRVRNETHRFTNSSHVRRRDREELMSVLERVPGIGERKRTLLYDRFQTIDDIRSASMSDICALPYFSKRDYEELHRFFQGETNETETSLPKG